MGKETFKSELFVGFESIFGHKCADRIAFLKDIPLRAIIYELAGLNHRLRAPIEKKFKTDTEDQIKELKYFCSNDEKIMHPYRVALEAAARHLQTGSRGKPIMFSRPAVVFALQDVLGNLPDHQQTDFTWTVQLWENLLKYYLCVNDLVSAYNRQENDLLHNSFEKLAACSGFTNEMVVVNDPIQTVHRFVSLMKFLENDQILSESFKLHFSNAGFAAGDFARHVFAMSLLPKGARETAFYYQFDPNDPEKKLYVEVLEYLGNKGTWKKIHELDMIAIKKTPVFKDILNYYVILDSTYLMDKLYESFINDFWFDTVRANKINVQQYRSRIGIFFEQHASNILREAFHFLNHPAPKFLHELKVNTGKGEIEIADFYFRKNKKICVGQMKSTGIYARQQYGTAQSLFDIKADDLYGVFGLYQLVESIRCIRDIPEEFDESFPKGHQVQVFPVLIVNEKIFQTPFFPAMFNRKFTEELSKEDFGDLDIKPLTIIHISDLERIGPYVKAKKADWWTLLKENYHNSLFPKQFNVTLNRNKINPNYDSMVKDFMDFGIISS